jgi:RNA polymerase sigma-70 factor (ECF subfamily)
MGDAEALVRAFLSRCARTTDDPAGLAATLAEKLERGSRQWPAVTLPPEAFAHALAERIAPGEQPTEALAQLRDADVYLAAAAALDAPGAIATFEAAILSRVPAYLARIGLGPSGVDEVKQILRVKLFVGNDDGGPRIRQYSGRGALESWVCAAAIRAARDLQRADARRQAAASDDDIDVLAASDDPELEVLRARYQSEFRIALCEALATLEARQRTLLRMHFFERLTTVELGRLYGVNQSTASRWLAEARNSVLVAARTRLQDRLGVSESQFESLIELLQSRMDLSFSRLLRAE